MPHWSESKCLLQENNQAEAQRKKCSNADHPDIHGHYRQAKVTHLHHHHHHCQLSSLHRQQYEITRSINNTNALMHTFWSKQLSLSTKWPKPNKTFKRWHKQSTTGGGRPTKCSTFWSRQKLSTAASSSLRKTTCSLQMCSTSSDLWNRRRTWLQRRSFWYYTFKCSVKLNQPANQKLS